MESSEFNRPIIDRPDVVVDFLEPDVLATQDLADVDPVTAPADAAVAAMALLTNFATIYFLFVINVVAILLIARLEERELLDRFGSRYAEYAKAVPRFLPRVRGLGSWQNHDAT